MRFVGEKLENIYGITCIIICCVIGHIFSENSSQIQQPVPLSVGGLFLKVHRRHKRLPRKIATLKCFNWPVTWDPKNTEGQDLEAAPSSVPVVALAFIQPECYYFLGCCYVAKWIWKFLLSSSNYVHKEGHWGFKRLDFKQSCFYIN
jgi:hypothetical protein